MNDQICTVSGEEQAIRQFLWKYRNISRDSHALRGILADVGRYYDADCVCLFELNPERTELTCTQSWCRAGGSGRDKQAPYAAFKGLQDWFAMLEKQGEFVFPSLEGEKTTFPELSQLLEAHGIHCLMAAPVAENSGTAGFLGVENPRANAKASLFLSVAASVCQAGIAAASVAESAAWPVDRMQIIQLLSEIYTSVYYIDIAGDCYWELASVGEVRTFIPSSGMAQERLNFYCRNMILPEYTEEMLPFVDLSTLDGRLHHEKIISREYQSAVMVSSELGNSSHWARCSFIVGDRDETGRLSHVIFATQSIHDAKIRELESRRKLRETNRDLEVLLAEEKRHTDIISALGNVYFALYYIDLENNTFQEMISQNKIYHMLGQRDDAREALKHMTAEVVGLDHQPIMASFTDFDTIDARLGNKSIIIQEFMAKTDGWCRCSFHTC